VCFRLVVTEMCVCVCVRVFVRFSSLFFSHFQFVLYKVVVVVVVAWQQRRP